MRLVLAQLRFPVGDVEGNLRRVRAAARRAHHELNAELVLFPELCLSGYPPDDLLSRPELHAQVDQSLQILAADRTLPAILLGHPERAPDGCLYNACSLYVDGKLRARYRKQRLPNYGVFDERRHFSPGREAVICELGGFRLAPAICEDLWHPPVLAAMRAAGAEVVLNLNASPYHLGKATERQRELGRRARENSLPVVYLNLVGGQDELVFDGASMVLDQDGAVRLQGPQFEEALLPLELHGGATGEATVRVTAVAPRPLPRDEETLYTALVTALRDYLQASGLRGAVLGLSGGIDSALCLCVAVDALGAEAVEVLLMPSRYSAPISAEDAAALATRLGVRAHTVPIDPIFDAFRTALRPILQDAVETRTEENLQARVRGTLLMALANKSDKILLATGNKSEAATGYMTLYGDMAGGFAPLKDLSKSWVYRLARWRNQDRADIPRRTLERPPSAELAPGQVDQDSLPPYDVLDHVISGYVEENRTLEELAAEGLEPKLLRRIATLILKSEHKRRQSPPGPKITRRAFGRERRYPISSGFRASPVTAKAPPVTAKD